MPIVASDIQLRLSGGAANANPALSIGGAKSANVAPTSLDGLFDKITGAESAAGLTDYRCVYVHNGSGLTWPNVRVFLAANANGRFSIGAGASAIGGAEPAAANDTTAPAGVTFSAPTTYAAGLPLGDIPAGSHVAVWLRSTTPAGASGGTDSCTLRVTGDDR